MDMEPAEIGKELRCADWTRRASDSSSQTVLYHLKFMSSRRLDKEVPYNTEFK